MERVRDMNPHIIYFTFLANSPSYARYRRLLSASVYRATYIIYDWVGLGWAGIVGLIVCCIHNSEAFR